MHCLALKIPPPAVTLITGALMWLVARAMPVLAFDFPYRYLVAASLVVAGVAIDVLGLVSFLRARTTINPLKPQSSSALVVSGIYTLTRNPMYLGLLLILLGWAVYLAYIAAFLFLPAFVLYMNRFQIAPEERALAALFGDAFAAYKMQVRRWL